MGDDIEFAVNPGWRILLHEMGVSAAEVVSAADLPADFLDILPAKLTPHRFFAFWEAVESRCKDKPIPLAMAQVLEADVFSPPLYAAICSRDLRQAARRVAGYKVLTGPTQIAIEDGPSTMTLVWNWPHMIDPPASMKLTEMFFWVFVARRCTRADISPVEITLTEIPDNLSDYLTFLNAPIRRDERVTLTFRKIDADQAFISVNEAIWDAFKPSLNTELHRISEEMPMARRVRSLLLRRIPSGEVESASIADELALTSRTLQRRLSAEGTNFNTLLNETRAELAKHYLKTTQVPLAEISFLLGYKDPNSFGRAFHGWTGETPNKYRTQRSASANDRRSGFGSG